MKVQWKLDVNQMKIVQVMFSADLKNMVSIKMCLRGKPYVNDCFFENFFQKNENIYEIGMKYMIILTIQSI